MAGTAKKEPLSEVLKDAFSDFVLGVDRHEVTLSDEQIRQLEWQAKTSRVPEKSAPNPNEGNSPGMKK